MKKWVLGALVILMLAGFVGAASIILEYPGNVSSGSVFPINLTLINFSNGVHDIKIDITNSSDDTDRLSEIWNGTVWTSTNYYVKSAMNTSVSNNSVFLLNITRNYNGSGDIMVRVDSTANTFSGYFLNITPRIVPPCIQQTTCTNSSCTNGNITQTCITTNATCSNSTSYQNFSCSSSGSTSITLSLSWTEEDIINGEEFEIEVNAENLESDEDYDVMVWIEDGNGDRISQRYGNYSRKEMAWKSGTYWAYAFLEDGDESKRIKIRIDGDYGDFSGEATIKAKIQKYVSSGDSADLDTFEDNIEVLAADEDADADNSSTNSIASSASSSASSSGAIKLGSAGSDKDSEEELESSGQSSIIYKSKNEYIREYAIYGFSLLCVGLIIMLLIDKK